MNTGNISVLQERGRKVEEGVDKFFLKKKWLDKGFTVF